MPTGSWRFRFPAFTCDESPRISAWLREVADYAERSPESGQPGILEFTEPNLRFAVAGHQPARLSCRSHWTWSSSLHGIGGEQRAIPFAW